MERAARGVTAGNLFIRIAGMMSSTSPLAIPDEESPRFKLLASMVKSLYPDYVIERKPYVSDSLRIHVIHSLKLALIMGKP